MDLIDNDYNSDDYKLTNMSPIPPFKKYFKVVIKGNTEAYEILDHYIMNNLVDIDECRSLIVSEKSHIKIDKKISNFYKLPTERITFKYGDCECVSYQEVNGTISVRDMFDSSNMSYNLIVLI